MKRANINRIHPGRSRCSQTQLTILIHEALAGYDSQKFRRLQKDIGFGFVANRIFRGDQHIETVSTTNLFQLLLDNPPIAPAGDRQRKLAAKLADHFEDWNDRDQMVNQFQKGEFLLVCRHWGIDGNPLLRSAASSSWLSSFAA